LILIIALLSQTLIKHFHNKLKVNTGKEWEGIASWRWIRQLIVAPPTEILFTQLLKEEMFLEAPTKVLIGN